MRLFAWQPKRHGPQSFFVMATHEPAARQAVLAELSAHQGTFTSTLDWGGWPDDYRLTIAGPGEVLMNDNA